MSFAAVMVWRGYLRGHLVLAVRTPRPWFDRIQTISPRNHVHLFTLRNRSELEGDLGDCLAAAYRVGRQEHLDR